MYIRGALFSPPERNGYSGIVVVVVVLDVVVVVVLVVDGMLSRVVGILYEDPVRKS